MPITHGIPLGPRRDYKGLFIKLGFVWLVLLTLLAFRGYVMKEVVERNITLRIPIEMNSSSNISDRNLLHVVASQAASSAESRISSSVLSSLKNYMTQKSASTRLTSAPSTSSPLVSFVTTTTLEYAYTSYRMVIPEKFKQCNPLTVRDAAGIVIKEPDVCLVVNETCCSCNVFGGKIDAINERFYGVYFSAYLHNCTGFGVQCHSYNSPTGCRGVAACVLGRCTIVNK